MTKSLAAGEETPVASVTKEQAAQAVAWLIQALGVGQSESADIILRFIEQSRPTPAAAADLHQQIMNLPCKPKTALSHVEESLYRYGHRDARHAAAELVSASPAAAAGVPNPERCRLLDELIASWREIGNSPAQCERRIQARAAVESAWPMLAASPVAPVGVPQQQPEQKSRLYRAAYALMARNQSNSLAHGMLMDDVYPLLEELEKAILSHSAAPILKQGSQIAVQGDASSAPGAAGSAGERT